MALGHKWAKRLKGGEPFVALFTHDKPNINGSKDAEEHRELVSNRNMYIPTVSIYSLCELISF